MIRVCELVLKHADDEIKTSVKKFATSVNVLEKKAIKSSKNVYKR